MKIQGLDKDDLQIIDKAFIFLMDGHIKQIKGACWGGCPEIMSDNIEALEETLTTYKKVYKEIRKYEKEQ